jgi:hypothetical protein
MAKSFLDFITVIMSLHSVSFKTLTVLLATIALIHAGHQGPSRITLESDGGYSGIVVKISDEVNDDYCSDIIENFQVGLCFLISCETPKSLLV